MKNILVAYDGTAPARRALETGIELVEQFGGSLGIVSVIPIHPGRMGTDPWDDKGAHDRHLDDARRLAASRGIDAEILEPFGEPADSIERVAEYGKFDTIVVGSRGLGWLSRIVMGSVSDHVATHATATVVIAR